ncbi:MAG: Maf family protein [Chitinophagales bacterium]
MSRLEPLILASASPRRRELLELLDLPFTVVPSRAPEPPFAGGDPAAYASALALAKAREVAARLDRGVVIGADTVVTLGGRVFGKPRDDADAAAMLAALSGRTHQVITGLALVTAPAGAEESLSVVTKVQFRELTPERIARYVATGEPSDKAGAYAIQGRAAAWVTALSGDYFNVVGLPVATLAELLERRGYPVL